MTGPSFEHRQGAHCESGTVTNILNHYGLPITEAMVFGVGAGIFFGYVKLKSFNFPKVINRSRPCSLLKGVPKRLAIKGEWRSFWSKRKANDVLDRLLDDGHIIAIQVDFFPLEYVPRDFRIHGNMHFVNVIGREDDNYIISDAYFPQIGRVSRRNLELARFAKGEMKPNGFMFRPIEIKPENVPWEKAVKKGIKDACFLMLKIPILPLGVKGIRKFAEKIVDWPRLAGTDEKLGRELLWFCIGMEDMGTGGAGFRYMYATFLKEAADVINNPNLKDFSTRMRENGDAWRELTVKVLRLGRSGDYRPEAFQELRTLIHKRADWEEEFFRGLQKEIK